MTRKLNQVTILIVIAIALGAIIIGLIYWTVPTLWILGILLVVLLLASGAG